MGLFKNVRITTLFILLYSLITISSIAQATTSKTSSLDSSTGTNTNTSSNTNTHMHSNANTNANSNTSTTVSHIHATVAHKPFAEYQASYIIQWNGFNVGKSVHTVRRLASNHYVAEARTEPTLAVIPLKDFEKSEFVINKHEMQPILYEFLTREKRKKIVGQLSFNWQEKSFRKKMAEKEVATEVLPDKAQDLISQLFQVRHDLRSGKKQFNFTVVSPKGIKHYHYDVIGEETLKTPAGTFHTVVLEHVAKEKNRRTRFWLSRDHDFMLIRLMQIKKGKVSGEAVVEHIKWL